MTTKPPTGPQPNPGARGSSYVPPARPPHIDLLLDGNEGRPPAVDLAALFREAALDSVRRYPNARALAERIARRHDIAENRVVVTAGADDAIDRCLRAFAGPSRPVIATSPTFEMIPRYAALVEAPFHEVEWLAGPFPVAEFVALAGDRSCVLAVVTPNNPTGLWATADDLRRLSQACPSALLMVDLAYGDFADDDLTATALALPNAVVLRSLSKGSGLAGLRVGYALTSPATAEALRAAGHPYPVSSLSVAVAARALDMQGRDRSGYVRSVLTERPALTAQCERLGLSPLPSQGNFVCCRTDAARALFQGLSAMGIAVRHFAHRPGLERLVRITLPGEPDEFRRLTNALELVRRPDAILFDMDGVLADVSRSYHDAIRAAASQFGVQVTTADIRRAKEEPGSNNDWVVTRRLVAAGGRSLSLAEATEEFEQAYQGNGSTTGLWQRETLIPSRSALEALAERFPLAIVTGRPRADAERFLQQTGIADLFAVMVCMEDAPAKPDPAPVVLAARRLGVERAWLLGDTPDDLAAARNAGVLPVGFLAPGTDRETGRRLAAAGAAAVISSIEELLEVIP